MIDIFTKVGALKESAKANRDFSEYEAALEDLEQAIEELNAQNKEGVATQGDGDKDRLDRELADCYGMRGGIYRRLANINKNDSELFKLYLAKALKSYKNGHEYEKDDSYNRSNMVVIAILLDPTQLIFQQQEITKGIVEIQKQVTGKRRDQWWAWADLGLFKLLSGDKKGALEAYSQFKQKGARMVDYESTIAVLVDLQRQLQNSNSLQAISGVQSIGEAIQFLEQGSIKNFGSV